MLLLSWISNKEVLFIYLTNKAAAARGGTVVGTSGTESYEGCL